MEERREKTQTITVSGTLAAGSDPEIESTRRTTRLIKGSRAARNGPPSRAVPSIPGSNTTAGGGSVLDTPTDATGPPARGATGRVGNGGGRLHNRWRHRGGATVGAAALDGTGRGGANAIAAGDVEGRDTDAGGDSGNADALPLLAGNSRHLGGSSLRNHEIWNTFKDQNPLKKSPSWRLAGTQRDARLHRTFTQTLAGVSSGGRHRAHHRPFTGASNSGRRHLPEEGRKGARAGSCGDSVESGGAPPPRKSPDNEQQRAAWSAPLEPASWILRAALVPKKTACATADTNRSRIWRPGCDGGRGRQSSHPSRRLPQSLLSRVTRFGGKTP